MTLPRTFRATPAELQAAVREARALEGRIQTQRAASPAALRRMRDDALRLTEAERARVARATASTLYDRTLADYMALRRKAARFAQAGSAWGRAAARAEGGRLAQLHRALLAMRPGARAVPPPPRTA